jgi:hypothetical protein
MMTSYSVQFHNDFEVGVVFAATSLASATPGLHESATITIAVLSSETDTDIYAVNITDDLRAYDQTVEGAVAHYIADRAEDWHAMSIQDDRASNDARGAG